MIQRAGWEARTRLLAEPLSPRGYQPVLTNLRSYFASPNGSTEPTPEYAGCSTKVSEQLARSIRHPFCNQEPGPKAGVPWYYELLVRLRDQGLTDFQSQVRGAGACIGSLVLSGSAYKKQRNGWKYRSGHRSAL
jgi:hypothetical protein